MHSIRRRLHGRARSGFTLVELTVSLAIFTVCSYLLTSTITATTRAFTTAPWTAVSSST